MTETVRAKFISKKVRKIRWRPRDGFGSPNPEFFVSGSWDDKVSTTLNTFIRELLFTCIYYFKLGK